VRDPFGRVQRLQDQFYTSDRLLRPGLHEYQYALGSLRRHYGEAGSDYGPAAFAGLHRWGVGDAVTLGLRLEGRRGQATGGPLATLRLGPAGVVSLAFATSRAGQVQGHAAALRHEYQSARGWLGLTLRRDSAGYASLSEPATLSNRRQEIHLAMGRRAGPTGTVSLTRSVLSVHAPADMPAAAGFQPAAFEARRATTLTYARTLPGAPGTFRATLSRVLDARGTRTELMLGMTLLLDGPSLLATNASFGDGGPGYSAQWTRNPPLGEGWGHDLSAYRQSLDGAVQGWRAATQWNAPAVRLRAQLGADQAQGQVSTRGRLSASGALTWLDGQWRQGRPVQDAWALVKVGDLPGVPVTVDGVPAGVTDGHGQLLVPQVGAWYESAFAIAPGRVPIDYALPRLERRIVLPDRAGAVVDFEARRLRAVIARLVVQAGGLLRPLARTVVRLSAQGQVRETSTGLQGELYLEDLPAGRHTGQVQAGRLDCRFILEVPPHADPVLDAGDLRCEAP
jgi:outer membrane usher protein